MSHQHREIDKKLKQLFDDVDAELEKRFGDCYPLHPARPAQGETANPAADGLFNIGAQFSAGYGSKFGRGYVLDVDLATLHTVSDSQKKEIDLYAEELVRKKLIEFFPNREMQLKRDGNIFKIVGDFGVQT